MLRMLIVGVALLAASLPSEAVGQADGGVAAYSQGHFRGFRTLINGPSKYRRPLVVRSLTVPAGTAWELCSGLTYTGCRQVQGSVPSMVMTVRSARPVAAVLPASAAIPGNSTGASGATGSGASLRGMASEFFVAPDEAGSRVEVQPATAEAMSRRAVEFCRARGWRSSPHGRLQTLGGRVYLADVLCADE